MHIKRTSAHDMRPGARPRFFRPSGRGGFTIVEMLVVLGIIVMLISILIVALSKAAGIGLTPHTDALGKAVAALLRRGTVFAPNSGPVSHGLSSDRLIPS